jgi:hypothetical protein
MSCDLKRGMGILPMSDVLIGVRPQAEISNRASERSSGDFRLRDCWIGGVPPRLAAYRESMGRMPVPGEMRSA